MKAILSVYKRAEKTFGSMKFAVIIISLFAIACTIGTFVESYNGTSFAAKVVYKTWWFMGIQLGMFLSILLSTVARLPFKKRLYGFYVIHLGLMLLFIGSAITYVGGIDGSIQLLPNKPSNRIILNEDILKVHFASDNKMYDIPLPSTGYATQINQDVRNIKLKDFYPFSTTKINWAQSSPDVSQLKVSSASYFLFNDNMSQEFTLSLHPQADFQSMEKLGLLNLHYMPESLYECFLKKSKHSFLIWKLESNQCNTIEELGLKVFKTDKGTDYIEISHQDRIERFFPNFSPMAVNDDLTKRAHVNIRVFSRELFKKKPHLFLFGQKIVHYQKRKKSWVGKDLSSNAIAKLPWMGFRIKLQKYSTTHYPTEIPLYKRPVQKSSDNILYDNRAIKISVDGQEHWVRSDAPLSISNTKSQVNFLLTKKTIPLPYEITLEKFVMKTNPGENKPASYESFVQLLDGRITKPAQKHHVFMNNPLKYDEFTFYQSSYFNVDKDTYASVFSVNYDPGRFLKYLGSLLLVLGSIWHYMIRRKKKKVTI